MAQLGARLDGIEEVVGSNPIGSTNFVVSTPYDNFQGALRQFRSQHHTHDLSLRFAFARVHGFAVSGCPLGVATRTFIGALGM